MRPIQITLRRMTTVILLSLTANFIRAADPQPPTARIVSPAPNASLTAQTDIEINVEVADPDGWVSRVELRADDKSVGEALFAPNEPPPLGETRTYTFHYWTDLVGRHTLAAIATDNDGNTVSSSAVEIVVGEFIEPPPPENRLPQVRITGPADRETFHAPATLDIRGEAVDFDGWVNRVELFANGSKIAEVTIPNSPPNQGETQTFSFHWVDAVAGEYHLSARATDNFGDTALSPQVDLLITEATSPVNRPPIVQIASPSDQATFTGPANVEIRVEGIDTDGWVAQVDLMANEAKIGEIKVQSAPIAQSQTMFFTWTNVLAGQYRLSARATDDSGATAVSAAIQIVVNPVSNGAPSVRLIEPSAEAAFMSPAEVSMTAEAADSDGWVQRVEFLANGVKIGEVNAPGPPPNSGEKQLFAFTWHSVSAGKFALLARATDNSGSTSDSKTVEIRVSAPPPPEPNPTPAQTVVTIKALDGHAAEAKGYSSQDHGNSGDGRGNSGNAPGHSNQSRGNSDKEHGKSEEPNTATFRVRREGNLDTDLRVYYSVGGTASNGVDYATLPGTVTIPRGAKWALITLTPINDELAEPTETVVLTLELPPDAAQNPSSAPYAIGSRAKAAVVINDDDSKPGSSKRLRDGHFMVWMPGMKGEHVQIEASDDLVHWKLVESQTVLDEDLYFVDADSPGRGVRYYRIVHAPGDSDDD